MGYGRLGSTVLDDNPSNNATSATRKSSSSKKLRFLVICAITLIMASGISVAVLVGLRTKASGDSPAHPHRTPTQAMSRACSKTRYPTLCVNSLLDFPGSTAASAADLVHLSVNMTLQHFGRALYLSSGISNMQMDALTRAAYDDCVELLDDSVEHLTRSLGWVEKSGGSSSDVMTWLSAALTNQDTCSEGLEGASGQVKDEMGNGLKDLSELVSNCLAIFAASKDDDDFSGVPIQNKRKLLGADVDELISDHHPSPHMHLPNWLSRRDRRLLDAPVTAIQADIVVSGSGNGSVRTITEAIKNAPEQSGRRFIIYVKAGKYQEDNLKVGRKKTNLMFIGDGKGNTIISGGKNVFEKLTTFRTASFAATGAGFIARDITFENFAGPSKHQAVALRVGADHAVIYRCNIIGYQDTLYVHSQRQFYRECDIYGTVDFIFGNAAVVFQHCNIYARKPMPMQKNTITAQNRKDPNQNTGISIHACRIVATADLEASKGSIQTFLGRPWKLYSRTVYLLSYMGDHIHPRGWLEWDGTFALDTLYYGEYMNSGPGGAVGGRVKWPGYRVITSPVEAGKYTVAQFIFGSAWLPPTGVAFVAGLTE